eukprot:12292804-Alexandrium_andersonii.AAC.1
MRRLRARKTARKSCASRPARRHPRHRLQIRRRRNLARTAMEELSTTSRRSRTPADYLKVWHRAGAAPDNP